MRLYGTFISGLDGPVQDILRRNVNKVVIERVFDGSVVFRGPCNEAVETPCFHNVFEVLRMEEAYGNDPIGRLMDKLVLDDWGEYGENAGGSDQRDKSFRIITSFKNRLVSVNRDKKRKLENLIIKSTRMKADRGGGGAEFWLLYRSEGYTLFARRLTRRIYSMERGTLDPALVYIMNWLSEPEREDVYFEPFAGSGALSLSRAGLGPFHRIWALDKDKNNIQRIKNRVDARNPSFNGIVGDVFNAGRWITPGAVTKIVTDPPWGLYEPIPDMQGFYNKTLDVFWEAAADGCRAVLLTAARGPLEQALSKKSYSELEAYSILVSGKKAGLYRFIIKKS